MRILIVDDEPLILEILDSQFSAMGHACKTANSPEAALELLADFSPSLIISDFRMPSFDGIELLSRIRAKGLKTPFFLMTGFSDKSRAMEAEKLQLSGIIEKPFQMSELKTLIATALPSS